MEPSTPILKAPNKPLLSIWSRRPGCFSDSGDRSHGATNDSTKTVALCHHESMTEKSKLSSSWRFRQAWQCGRKHPMFLHGHGASIVIVLYNNPWWLGPRQPCFGWLTVRPTHDQLNLHRTRPRRVTNRARVYFTTMPGQF